MSRLLRTLGAEQQQQQEEVEVAKEVAPAAEEEEEEADDGSPPNYLYGDLRIPVAIEEAWLDVQDPEVAADWLVVSYAREDESRIEVVGHGDGGLGACRACLAEAGRVFWGGFRVYAVDTRRGVVSSRPKLVFFMCAGDEVDIKLKTRGLLHMGAIAEVLQQSHVSFEVQGPDDLSAEIVANKLQQCGGAHKPNAYDFGGGEVLQLEYYTKPA